MQTIYLDISHKGVIPKINAKQEEVGRKFLAVLTDGGVPFNIPDDAVLSVWYDGDSGKGNYSEIDNKTAVSVDKNKITVELIAQMLKCAGRGVLTILINSADGQQIGLWNIDYSVEMVPGLHSQQAEEYYTAFSKATEELARSAQTISQKQNEIDSIIESRNKTAAGLIYPIATANIPEGFLPCDGAAYSRTEYAELFEAIGTTYGEGDEPNTFKVPDLATRVPVGAGGGYGLGDFGGESEHTLTVDEMPEHSHTMYERDSYSYGGAYHGLTYNTASGAVSTAAEEYSVMDPAGGNKSHNNMPPYVVVNYIISTGKKIEFVTGNGMVSNFISIDGDAFNQYFDDERLTAGSMYLLTSDANRLGLNKGDIVLATSEFSFSKQLNIVGETGKSIISLDAETFDVLIAEHRLVVGNLYLITESNDTDVARGYNKGDIFLSTGVNAYVWRMNIIGEQGTPGEAGASIHSVTGDELNGLALYSLLTPGDLYVIKEDATHDNMLTKGKIFKALDEVNFKYEMNLKGDKGEDYVLTEADKEEIAQAVPAVRYTEQTLTPEEQAQARKNIGVDIVEVVESVNLFNKDDETIQNGVYIEKSGAITPLTVDRHMITHKIAAKPNTTYVMGYSGEYAPDTLGGLYNSEDVWIANISGSIVGDKECFTFTTPNDQNIAYMRLNVDKRKFDTLMVVEGDTYPTEYIAYDAIREKVFADDIKLNENQLKQAKEYSGVDIVAEQISNIVETVESVNLFNKDSTENKAGYLLQKGNEVALSGYGYSHPIAVQDGNTYYVTKSGDVSANYVATLYDANGSVLRGTTRNVTNPAKEIATNETDEYWYFTIPDGLGASYMRCSYKENKIDAFMVVETDTAPTGYMPFVESKTVIKDSALPLLVRTINGVKPDENGNIVVDITNPLYGKKLALNGDSICYGAGATGGYGAYIAENNNMTLQNIGVSGGTITAEVYKDSGSARHWICRTIANMDADADYAIVEGGVNDSSLAVPLGAITADYDNTFDDTTFYGAFESMLNQLLIRFAGKKVGYIAVHQMSANFRASNDKETSYYWAAKLCCEKWGVPFLDLNTTVPPFGLIRNITKQADLYAATRAVYTANADGWHPNEEGYQKYYVPKIEAWLKTL